jgi:CDP-diacylglycerol--glycerol-3-phosphate 3-phosphatidyltransferase
MAFERDPKKLFPHDYLLKYTIVPLIPSFITPNAVTIFRLVCTPVALWFLYIENYAVGVPFFVFLAFTDALDGTLARLRNKITAWGTFYDPVADKLLIGSVVLLVVAKYVGLLFGLTIIGIEVAIILGAHHRRRKGKFHGANVFGKTKMFLQVAGVTLLLISIWSGWEVIVPYSVATLSLAIVFAVISLLTYGL